MKILCEITLEPYIIIHFERKLKSIKFYPTYITTYINILGLGNV